MTERDLFRTATCAARRATEVSVGQVCSRQRLDLMTPDPLVAAISDSVIWAANLMLQRGATWAVAMGEDGLRGVVTCPDIACAGERGQLDRLNVEDVCVEVDPLSVENDLERAITLATVAGGRPVTAQPPHASKPGAGSRRDPTRCLYE